MTTKTSATYERAIDLKSTAALMIRAAALDEKTFGKKDDAFLSAAARTRMGLFSLVVMGEIKKGKSSFINAMLGLQNLIPTATGVATSTVYKIRYGDAIRYTVYFKEGKPKKVIPLAELANYGTEMGNPNNTKGVDFIGVEAPAALLQDGLLVVDTPGVGGLYREHRAITFQHVPKADAVFFVTDSEESPIGSEEIKFLQELRKTTGLIYFVQTKGDRADAEARRKRMDNNIDILTTQVGIPKESIRYFVVSSKIKDEGDLSQDIETLRLSGFAPLISFLVSELKNRKDRNTATIALGRTKVKLESIATELDAKARLLDADSEEKRKAIEKELREADAAIQEWNNHRRVEIDTEFKSTIEHMRLDANTKLATELRAGGRIAQNIKAKLNTLLSAKDIYEHALPLFDDAKADASRLLLESSRMATEQSDALLQSLIEKAGAQLSVRIRTAGIQPQLQDISTVPLNILMQKTTQSDFFTKAKSTSLGISVGAGLAAIVGGVIGCVIGPVGAIIGSHFGMALAGLWGGYKGLAWQGKQDRSQALNEVMGTLNQMLGDCQLQVQNSFAKVFMTIEQQGSDALRQIVQQTTESIERKRKEVALRCGQTQKGIAQEKANLGRLRDTWATLQRELSAIEKSVS